MTNRQQQRHSLFGPDLGPYGPPTLPTVGGLYLVRTLLYQSDDPADKRRAVVVGSPSAPGPLTYVRIATRTSKTTVAGVRHPADLSIGCDVDGVFSEPRVVLSSSWRPGDVKLLGILPAPYLADVLDRFG